MKQEEKKPEISPTPHTPEIKPEQPPKVPPMPHHPEIQPGKKDPPPTKGPAEVPPKQIM